MTLTAVDSTTPTFQANYNNLCSGDDGQVEIEVLSMSGTNLGGCATGEVSPGEWAQCTYYPDAGGYSPSEGVPLQVGEEYQVHAVSESDEDGEPVSGAETGTFWVDARMGSGTESWMTNISWHPDSQMTVSTNVASGELNISMAMLQSEAGVDLPINLNFVSSAVQNGASGDPGKLAWDWIDTFGESLYVNPNGESITYFAPDGQSAAFISQGTDGDWNSPGDMPVTLYTDTWDDDYSIVWNTADDSHAAGQIDTFNSTGQLVDQESATGQSLGISYNTSNQPSTMTTSTGRTFDFDYYTSGSLSGDLEDIREVSTTFEVQLGYNSGGYLDSIENPDSGITQFGYQTLNHQITTITTPAGRELLIGYDSTGTQVTSVAEQDSDFSTNPKWTFTYTQPTYATGGTQCTSSNTFKCGSTVVQDPNAHSTTYTWDNADRVTNTKDVNGLSQPTTWNSDNNVVSTSTGGNVESFTWDPDTDLLDTITNPSEMLDGSSVPGGTVNLDWTTGYPYTLYQMTDSTNASSTYTYTYNSDGEVSKVVDGLTDRSENTETATYEGISGASCGGLTGDLCSITDFNGNTTSYEYNSTGELTTITPPTAAGWPYITQLGATTFGYNALGQVSSQEDGRGDTTSYLWNGEGQITKVTYQDSSNVQLNYDADGNLLSEDAPGGDSTFTYNPAGLTKTSDINGDSTSYTYDPVGNLLTMDDSTLGNTTYNYTNVNELHQVIDPWGHTSTYAYESVNDELLHTISLPGSITETYGYDSANRVTSYAVTHSSTNLITDNYDYFSSGGADSNLLQSDSTTTAAGTSGDEYTYDPLERLIEDGTYDGSSYGEDDYYYDGDGGMTEEDNGSTENDYSLNENEENDDNTYDADGDLTSSPVGAFSYNAAGQTSSITPSGGSAESISYLSDGQTLPTNYGSTNLGYNVLGLDSTTNGSASNKFLRTPDGALFADYTSSTPYYYLVDPTGSVIGLTNTSGTEVDTYTYDPYGNVLTHTGTVTNPFGYESGYNIPSTDLVHFGERYYDPSSQTWTQLDPSGQDSGYGYADDDPVNAADPSGTVSILSYEGGVEQKKRNTKTCDGDGPDEGEPGLNSILDLLDPDAAVSGLGFSAVGAPPYALPASGKKCSNDLGPY